MATFTYKAKDKSGSIVEGNMDADGKAAVVSRLQQMGYFPMRIVPAGAAGKAAPKTSGTSKSKTAIGFGRKKATASSSSRSKAVAKPTGSSGFSGFRKGLKAADIASFNRQLADLIGAGIPLVKALGLLGKQTQNEELHGIIMKVLEDVQEGATFADALSKHERVFSKLYVAMVRSGEAGGMLGEVLNRLADLSESEEQLKGKIKSALAYPAVMVLAGSGAVFVMFSFVIPKITGTFEQLNQALPAPTEILIRISEFTQSYWYLVLGGLALLIMGTYQFINTAEGRAMWHRLQLKLPVFGDLIRKREVARFTRTLGSLLRNGVSILTALEIVKEVQENTIFKEEVEAVVEEITQGASMAKPLTGSAVFPPVAINMIAIGEETGRLPDVLLRISDSFEGQVDRSVRALTSLIEPVIIVVMGIVIGFIVIAMLLPIFSLDPTGGG